MKRRRSHGDDTSEGDTGALPDFGTTLPLASSGYEGGSNQVKRNLFTALISASLVPEGESTNSKALVVSSKNMLARVAAKASEYIDYETMLFSVMILIIFLMLLLAIFGSLFRCTVRV